MSSRGRGEEGGRRGRGRGTHTDSLHSGVNSTTTAFTLFKLHPPEPKQSCSSLLGPSGGQEVTPYVPRYEQVSPRYHPGITRYHRGMTRYHHFPGNSRHLSQLSHSTIWRPVDHWPSKTIQTLTLISIMCISCNHSPKQVLYRYLKIFF